MVIKTEKELVSYLRRLREQAADPAAALPPAPAPAAPAPAAAAPPASAPGTTTPDGAVVPVTVEDIVDKLNIVRSGRSTKDSDVKRELDEYINQFNEDEKTALLAFLAGLGQILTSGVDSADAVDPEDPYALQIKKSLGASTANATRPPAASVKPAAAPATAPTPGPVPIKIGGA
jgi:hypothetical protein